MERLSVSECISKRWTTLKTEGVGGPSSSRELKQYNGGKRDINNNRFKLAKQQLNLHVHHAFLSVAVVARLWLEMPHVLSGK